MKKSPRFSSFFRCSSTVNTGDDKVGGASSPALHTLGLTHPTATRSSPTPCSPRSVSPLSMALLSASLLLFIFRRRGTCSPERGSYSSSCQVGGAESKERHVPEGLDHPPWGAWGR